MNFYLLLDDSPSMAIGATQTDINNLITATASTSHQLLEELRVRLP